MIQDYSAYVWSAYGVTFLVLGAWVLHSQHKLTRTRKRLSELEQAKTFSRPS